MSDPQERHKVKYYSFDGWILQGEGHGKPLLMEKILEIMNNENALQARVKELEDYLRRYEAITERLYQIGGEKWILDPVYDELVELRRDIKQESTDD